MTLRALRAGFAGLVLTSCHSHSPAHAIPALGARVIRISGFQFAPASLTVVLGDTVVWVNEDRFRHTATADGGAWASAELAADGRYAWVAGLAGDYPYHCAAHPGMKGVVAVR